MEGVSKLSTESNISIKLRRTENYFCFVPLHSANWGGGPHNKKNNFKKISSALTSVMEAFLRFFVP